MKRYNREQKFKVILILAIVIVLSSALTVIYYSYSQQKEYRQVLWEYNINASVRVSDTRVGMDGNTDALRFGIVPKGGGSDRSFTISLNDSNLKDRYKYENLTVIITGSGNITRFMYFDKNNFIMDNSTEKITASVSIPKSADIGIYEGQVHVMIMSQAR